MRKEERKRERERERERETEIRVRVMYTLIKVHVDGSPVPLRIWGRTSQIYRYVYVLLSCA